MRIGLDSARRILAAFRGQAGQASETVGVSNAWSCPAAWWALAIFASIPLLDLFARRLVVGGPLVFEAAPGCIAAVAVGISAMTLEFALRKAGNCGVIPQQVGTRVVMYFAMLPIALIILYPSLSFEANILMPYRLLSAVCILGIVGFLVGHLRVHKLRCQAETDNLGRFLALVALIPVFILVAIVVAFLALSILGPLVSPVSLVLLAEILA